MPEGPEIRREANALARVLVDRPLVQVDYRVPRLAARARRLRARRITRVTSHGKALLIEWDGGLTHYSHNQLYGSWHVVRTPTLARWLERRERSVRVVLATTTHAAVLLAATEIDLLGPRDLARHPYLARLGPDALDRATTPAQVAARLRSPAFARRSLAALLLDQRFLAGLGNYLRSEILHVARLRHTRRPCDLGDAAVVGLARATLALPRQSLATRGVTNDRRLAVALRKEGVPFDDYRFRVYGREGRPCYVCGTAVRRVEAGRAIYFCPRCQAD